MTTAIKEDWSRDEEDCRDAWGRPPPAPPSLLVKAALLSGSFLTEPAPVPSQEQKPAFEEPTPTKPVQSVAPQVREPSSSSAWESGSDNLVELWDGGSEPQTSKPSDLLDLMDEAPPSTAAAATAAANPQSLLSFDEMMDGTFCSGPEDEPASLVDLTAPEQMTLSYQHALQHASGEELDDGQLLTNGETLLKEGTQVRTRLDSKGGGFWVAVI